MHSLPVALALFALSLPAPASEVDLSIRIDQPGFYGRIDIGDAPKPRVIYTQPGIIEPAPAPRGPVYLRVPPKHAKNWRKYCRKYNACGEQVYFVQDDWYRDQYVPQYRERHDRRDGKRDDRQDDRRGKGRGGDDRDDHRGRDH